MSFRGSLSAPTTNTARANQFYVFVDGTIGAFGYARHPHILTQPAALFNEIYTFIHFRPRPPFLPHVDRSSRCFKTVVFPPDAPIHRGQTRFVPVCIEQ